MRELVFYHDNRADPDDARQRQFIVGFHQALAGRTYTAKTLKMLTWNNLGWRLGRIYGAGGEAIVDELWSRSVRQYMRHREEEK
jgi:hypothetical protein